STSAAGSSSRGSIRSRSPRSERHSASAGVRPSCCSSVTTPTGSRCAAATYACYGGHAANDAEDGVAPAAVDALDRDGSCGAAPVAPQQLAAAPQRREPRRRPPVDEQLRADGLVERIEH